MTPAACDHVVLQLPEVDISHLGKNVPCEIDRERSSAQLVVVDIVRVTRKIGVERQVDRRGEDILEPVIQRDRDRDSTVVDRETILVNVSHPLVEVVKRTTPLFRL